MSSLTPGFSLSLSPDHVGHVPQGERVALGPIGARVIAAAVRFPTSRDAFTRPAVDLVAHEGRVLDGVQDSDLQNLPIHRWAPEDRLAHASCGRRRHDRIGDTFHLHLGSGETGQVSPYFDFQRGIV